jgi:hypothetical protein
VRDAYSFTEEKANLKVDKEKPVRLRDQYDWVVFGSHPGALLSASLVAKLGLSVLVLPLAPSAGLTISQSGQYLDPESNYLMGVGKIGKVNGLVLECLNRLGILSSEEELIQTENVFPQILTPDFRLILASNEDLQTELLRELGKVQSRQFGLVNALKQAEAEYAGFWSSLPKRLTLNSIKRSHSSELKTLKDLQRRLLRNFDFYDASLRDWGSASKKISLFSEKLKREELSEVFAGILYFITSSTSLDLSLFDTLHILSLSRSAGRFRGGLTAYRKFLLNLAGRLGAHIPIKAECRKILVERGRFAGVQVAGRAQMIAASGGVLGCSLEKAYSRMNFNGRSWLHRRKKGLLPVGWKLTLALTVTQDVIPSKMLSRVIWQEKRAPPLEIEVINPIEYELPESKNSILFIRTVMPYTQESLKQSYQKLIASRMLRQAMEVLPFLEAHMIRIYPDFRAPGINLKLKSESAPAGSISDEFLEMYGFPSLELIPDNLKVFEGKGVGSTTGIDRLCVAAEESYPSLGSLGGTIAAVESVAWVAHQCGLAGPFN